VISVLRGSKQLELGSRGFSATWVNHLGLRRGSGRLGEKESTVGADLHDGASPARAFRSKRGLKVYDI
jgi:hypothetical protein